MKKTLFLALLLGLIYTPAKADLFGFLDGKLYDESGTLKYICFMNGECLDESGKVSTREQLLGANSTPTYQSAEPTPYNENQTINKIDLPVGGVVESQLLKPAYMNEQEVANAANKLVGAVSDKITSLAVATSCKADTYTNSKFGEKTLSGVLGVISWNGYMADENSKAREHARVLFNGQEVLGTNNIPYYFNYPINKKITTEYLGQVFLENLEPNKVYQYQLVWTEAGREDTVITKTFTSASDK